MHINIILYRTTIKTVYVHMLGEFAIRDSTACMYMLAYMFLLFEEDMSCTLQYFGLDVF